MSSKQRALAGGTGDNGCWLVSTTNTCDMGILSDAPLARVMFASTRLWSGLEWTTLGQPFRPV
ncbi:MAG: hypothetical protein ACJ788_05725 [Ktedonobacteraceae bacterium]